jgi:hypothetical protein
MFIKTAQISVETVLDKNTFEKRHAAKKIVEYDPEFVYVAVRALTADKPNSNGDCFPHDELIRIDPILHRPVYASFIGKGVYINHRHTDDPTQAKGIVLDARYVTANENDKYVELLLAIDKKRDPVFASNVERGIINKFSMGASVQFTKCSVCGNEARRKEDFCDHIAKFKMRECVAPDGTKKLAFEKCYGVTYNEISAVSDPADETAQILAKIASTKQGKSAIEKENSVNLSHGTVVLLNEINARLKSVEAAVMQKAAQKKIAQPLEPEKPLGEETPDAAVEIEESMPEGTEQLIQVLDAIKEFAEGKMPAADLVETLEASGLGPEKAPGELPPGAQAGEPQPPATDMAPQASARRESFSALVDKLAQEYANKMQRREAAMVTKNADSKSPKVEKGQYPHYNVQDDPPQSESSVSKYKTHKSRPASDFDSDAKEYAKMWNISAEFKPHADKREAAWVVSDGDTPLFKVTGAGAWEDMLDEKWAEFSSREYGENLVRAIFEDGLEKTMEEVNAEPISAPASAPTTARAELDEKLIKAAEAKAEDLANEKVAEFKTRFLEGLKVAFELQNKNVIDNPIKAAAYEVLTAAGHDGSLAEKIADAEIVQTHFDEAMKEALRYSEMTPEAFEEVKAHVKSLPSTRVVEAQEKGVKDEELANIVADVTREAMSKRAAVNVGGLRPSTSDDIVKSRDDRLRAAVRSGISKTANTSPIRPPVSTLRRVRGGVVARM